MKSNFILTPDTVHLFMKRFTKLLSVTGMVEEYSYWNGRQKVRGMLEKMGIGNHFILPVTKTCSSFIDKDTYSYDSYPAMQKIGTGKGLIIRINSDSCIVIGWRSKIKMTPNRMILLSNTYMPLYYKCGATSIFRITTDVSRGKYRNQYEEMYAKEYWDSIKDDMLEDLIQIQ